MIQEGRRQRVNPLAHAFRRVASSQKGIDPANIEAIVDWKTSSQALVVSIMREAGRCLGQEEQEVERVLGHSKVIMSDDQAKLFAVGGLIVEFHRASESYEVVRSWL